MILTFIKNNIRPLLLLILLSGLCFFYKIPQHIQDRPYGQHIWRQCDGASFAWTYTHVSMNFFEPRLINVYNADAKMCPEFPIVYYVAACLNKLFGYQEAYIRIIHLTFFFIGLFALSSIVFHLTKHTLFSLIIPLLLFTSTMFVFYGPNFLPDVAAISMGFVGAYFLMQYKKHT